MALIACAGPAVDTGVRSSEATPSPATVVSDPAAAGLALERARHPEGGTASTLPSGRTDYRRPADVGPELADLARARADILKIVTLPRPTVLGSPVQALEITHDVTQNDSKPVFLLTGAHHANEWPTVDTAVEWATELASKDHRDTRVTALLDEVRVIVVPMVNPDGYAVSRDTTMGDKRRNCGIGPQPSQAACADKANAGLGVDLNRNYGVNWGGPGSSADPAADDYRGPAPFSEPETRNIRDLVSARQVTVLVSMHTFAAMTLRPPTQQQTPDTPDEATYAALATAMADASGYRAIRSRELYETSGSATEWSYYTTGGLGFEAELGGDESHAPFERGVVQQYFGTDRFLPAAGGVRESLYRAAEAAADEKLHSVITGNAPPGALLKVTRSFSQSSADNDHSFTSELSSTLTAHHGAFTWAVNPSVRALHGGGVRQEAWTLTCGRPDGPVLQETRVSVARGQRTEVGLAECARRWGTG